MSTKRLQIIGSIGNKIYTQNDEPIDAKNGSIWIDLDEENAAESSVDIDSTLTQENAAADAKAVGDAIAAVNEMITEINEVPDATSEDEGKFLRVINGTPSWQTIQNAEEVSF